MRSILVKTVITAAVGISFSLSLFLVLVLGYCIDILASYWRNMDTVEIVFMLTVGILSATVGTQLGMFVWKQVKEERENSLKS